MRNILKWQSNRGVLLFVSIFILFFSLIQVHADDSSRISVKENDKFKKSCELDAHRVLSPAEKLRLSDLIKTMQNKHCKSLDRYEAARKIGIEIGHIEAIKPLLHTLENLEEEKGVRYRALTAISQITDKSVVPILLRFLDDPSATIRQRANEQLMKLSGSGMSFSFWDYIPKEERAESAKKWRDWWAKNEKTFVFKRSRVMLEM